MLGFCRSQQVYEDPNSRVPLKILNYLASKMNRRGNTPLPFDLAAGQLPVACFG